MRSYLDKVLLTIAVSVMVFLIASYISDSYLVGLGVLCLFTILIFLLTKIVVKDSGDYLSKKELMRSMLLEGKEYTLNMLEKAFSHYYTVEKINDGISVKVDEKLVAIHNAFKFGSLGEEDIAAAFRNAKAKNIEEIYFFYNTADRRALVLANYIPQKVHLLPFKSFYRIAKKAKLLPPPVNSKKPRRWGLIVKSVFSYANIRFFLFAAISTALLSIFTPMRTYYLIFSLINIALAIIVALISSKQEKLIF
ncbi:MAG: hypothetical protein EOM87_02300 [Clostridia bacterium]|nr:hypothetical protein [Clostridia bacterium]